jgi:uncharacterized iron-regulated protein
LVTAIFLSPSRLEAEESPATAPAEMAPACRAPGGWVDVATGDGYDRRVLFRDLAAEKSVVLLGESHDNADHHRWQLHTLAALHGRVEKMVIGFEAFPRRVQPVLDEWVAGKLTADAFVKASDWSEIWGFDADLYMPLFQFARLHSIPMVALNVERKLVSRVGEEGWAAISENEREGLSEPAPASADYERRLVHVYVMERPAKDDESEAGGMPHAGVGMDSGEAALANLMGDPKFRRFVEAQLTWDRAMAEALAAARRDFPGATVAGIVGSGHLAGGYGVPHQLEDLGVDDAAILLPVEAGQDCQEVVGGDHADAVFALPPALAEPAPQRPRLGIVIADGDRGVRIREVVADSLAEATGLREADEIVSAAGVGTQTAGELIEIVSRQAPGTWLPLSVMRDGKEIEFVAKFPPRPRPEPR